MVHLLRLLGSGATGGILMALRDGPLRTKELTRRVPGYSPRTVYRYGGQLVVIGAIEREVEAGVPSKVVHHLTDPNGIELCELVEAYAMSALDVLPEGGIVPHSWGLLTLIADLWESGMYEALNRGPRTMTELARVDHDLSFHQVSRRTILLLNGDLVREWSGGGRRRRYELTEKARQAAALIVGLGLWRERHVFPDGTPGLTQAETAEVLRAALPLVVLPEYAGKSLKLGVMSPESRAEEEQVVWAEADGDGVLSDGRGPIEHPDGWARGEVGHWLATLLQGTESRVEIGGSEGALVKACLRELRELLWTRRDSGSPAADTGDSADSSPVSG